jgi:HAD superfamily hydrolase (TIGR01509 family)
MLKAVLLDVDGTLVDSNALHAEAWERSFAHFGFQVDFYAALRQIGKGGDQLLPIFIPEEQLATMGKAVEQYRKELFEREYLTYVRPFPQVRQLVERMLDAGLQVAIASSASKAELQSYKKIARIDDLIVEETTSQDAEQSKPHPDIFAAVLERLGVNATEAVSIGDTPYDAEASMRAGVRIVGVTSGGWSQQDLQRAGCVEVYRNVTDLLAHFDRSILGRELAGRERAEERPEQTRKRA